MDLILKPYRVATSKPAQKTYLNTILFLITSLILLGLAVFAYILFYFNYVPQIGIERVIHLQYGDGLHPHGITTLDSSLISGQPYDITLSLHVPLSPPNLDQGNFMLSLTLLSPNHNPSSPPATATTAAVPLTTPQSSFSAPLPEDIIYASRRPAILIYTSQLVSLSHRLLNLPLYVLGFKHESELLTIPMGESIAFSKGWKNIPSFALLQLQAGQDIQVYSAHLKFVARFGGMRWLMYNHRILSFVIFTGAFWGAECVATVVAWVLLSAFFSSKSEKGGKIVKEKQDAVGAIKQEEREEPNTEDDPDLSDTPRTFPTYGRQAPLRYEPKVKDEGEDEEYVLEETEIQPLNAEADDEEEYESEEENTRGRDRDIDSGIGTSFSEGPGVVRRRSKGGKAI